MSSSKLPFDKIASQPTDANPADSAAAETATVPADSVRSIGPIDNPESAPFLSDPQFETEKKPIPGMDTTRERVAAGPRLPIDVSERRQKEWGLQDDEVMVNLRNPRAYDGSESDRLDRFEDEWETARFLTNPRTKEMPRHQDTVYAAVKKWEWDRRQAAHDDASKTFFRNVSQGRVQNPLAGGTIEDFRNDKDYLEQKLRETEELLAGFSSNGRFPRSMTLEEIEAHVGAEEIERTERRAARNFRSERPNEIAEYRAFLKKQGDEVRAEESRARNRNRSYSFAGSPTR